MNKWALEKAIEIQKLDSKSIIWIASNAISELNSDAVQQRFHKKSKLDYQ